MNGKQRTALEKVHKALEALEQEELKGETSWVFASRQQIEMFRSELKKMASELAANNMPPTRERSSGMGRVIADSWPLTSSIAEAILVAESAYKSV